MEKVISYKGFDTELKCRGFQFEIGGSYQHEGHVQACRSGFHACEHPLDVFGYYAPAHSRFAIVEQSGELDRHDDDTKIASAEITIKAEISVPQMIEAAVKWVFDRADWKKGNSVKADGAGASATGDRGAASATGDRGAASATGYSGAASATGDSGAASATGDSGAASATGYSGAASATGYSGAASATGSKSVAIATGWNGKAKASKGSALFLCHRDEDDEILHVFAGIAGRDGVKPDTWYSLDESGNLAEV